MAVKNYVGKCGSCKYLRLDDSYRPITSSSYKFRCTRGFSGSYYFAHADACSSFEPDRSRTNEVIAKYDR